MSKVSKDYGITRSTSGRNRNTAVSNQGVVQLGRCNTVSSENMEETHVSRIHDKERGVYDLTTIDVRHLAYEIVEKHNINHCFGKNTKMAELDWLKGFLN